MRAGIDFVIELGVSLVSAPDAAARAGLLASAAVAVVTNSACVVHRVVEDESGPGLVAIGIAGDLTLDDPHTPLGPALLAAFRESPDPQIFSAAGLRREDYAHLHVARSIASIACLPLYGSSSEDGPGPLVGVLELVLFTGELSSAHQAALAPVLRLAGPAILAGESAEAERQNLLNSVHRMSQLYDLEKSLNATLELDEVTAMAPTKTRSMLDCQAVHLWLFDGEILRLMASGGEDATVQQGITQAPGRGYVADMAEEGEALLIDDADDERLTQRNAPLAANPSTTPITTALLVPLMQGEAEVGVLEAVNKTDGIPFDDDDQFFLMTMAETVSSALKNASLMHAERKLEILETLVNVSSEITSTLRLDRLLQIVVNRPQSVLPYEVSAIALDHRGSLQLKAVSGRSSLPLGDAQVDRINELMRWLELQPSQLHLRLTDESDAASNLPGPVLRHFQESGTRALYSLPLMDDQGRVGLLLYESSNPDFLDLPHTEMIKILGAQATVAIRNAMLYREVPLISLLEPLAQRKRALQRTNPARRKTILAAAALAGVLMAICPLPMRISAAAIVAPQHLVSVDAPVDGNVAAVYARDGQRVQAGELLGALNDWQWRMELASAEAKYHSAQLVMEDSLAHNAPQAGADRAQAEFLRAEVDRMRSRVESAQLRSPITGIVTTPSLENAAGEHLDAGATFAQVLDLSRAVVDIAVPQSTVSFVAPGQSVTIKLDSYPQSTWHGKVDVLSPSAVPINGERAFVARVALDNQQMLLRAGMTGRAKIFIGYRPAGSALLGRPTLWLWQTLWNWIGW